MIELIHRKGTLVFGCGNPLFGDDGFGPAVVEHMETYFQVPEHVACIDVGTSIRDILFDILLSEKRPDCIVVVDAADKTNEHVGEIFEIDVDEISPKKISDFSLHQFPTTNMLKELKDETDIDIRILVAGITELPDEVCPGISEPVKGAIPDMCRKILEIVT